MNSNDQIENNQIDQGTVNQTEDVFSSIPCLPGTFAYRIMGGDTCWSIAQRYGISVSELTAANPGIDCYNLPVGGILCIPVRCRPGTFPYMIQRGDTCWSIAQRYGISVSELTAANPGIDCNNLPVGGTLCIPRR
ncbi:MAG: LysM domain-containing protein [Firmicutes bacterium]|nr:LysM domain-containing protein [Bacillota bacterium]